MTRDQQRASCRLTSCIRAPIWALQCQLDRAHNDIAAAAYERYCFQQNDHQQMSERNFATELTSDSAVAHYVQVAARSEACQK